MQNFFEKIELKMLINAGGIVIALFVLYFLMNNVQAGIENINSSLKETVNDQNATVLRITQDQNAALLQLSKVVEGNTKVLEQLNLQWQRR